jgi:hypothetical protein
LGPVRPIIDKVIRHKEFSSRQKNFLKGDGQIGCYYLKRFSYLQGHLYRTEADQKSLESVAMASFKQTQNVAECLDASSSLNSRYAAVQLDLLNLSKDFKTQGFDFWNSVKIYYSWAWRNDEEIASTMGDFARYEQFAAVVVVTSLIPGRTCREVICRLQELTLVVESAIREAAPLLANPLSGGPVADMAAAGLWAIGLSSPAWSVQPTQEGYGGRAVIRVGFQARI